MYVPDPSCRKNLMAALQALAEPVGNRETSPRGTSPEAEARREAAEDAKTKANAEASGQARVQVARCQGKRAAAVEVSRR